MRAVVVRRFGGPEVLEVIDAPVPEPRAGEVRVKVEGAGVNIADVIVRTGMNVQYGATSEREQYGLGSEFAGTVDALGAGVTGVSVGDAVIGTQERLDTALGSQAELVVVDSWALAPAPVGTTSIEAAGLPLPGITALQALDTLALEPGQTLLVTGAAGGVGGYAVELGVLRGLRVIAHAAAAEEDRLRSMGAELFVPRDVHLADTVRDLVPGGADGALDAANLVTAADDAVRHGGSYANLLNAAPQSRRQIRPYNIAWHSDPGRLSALSAFASAGRLTVRVAATFSFDDVAKAHELVVSGGLAGRVVLVP